MVSANNAINNTVGASISGVTNTLTVTNPSNTASSQALVNVTVGGGTAGDAFTTYTVSGVTNWSEGIDNSASDAFVIAASTALGTTNVVSMATGGAVSCVLGNFDVTRSASGADVSATTSNTSNTASSNATLYATVAGTSAGDARTQYAVSGTTTWTQGVDNSDSDVYALAASTALGTTNVMRATTAGEINYPLQPAFLAYLNADVSNVTGDGTIYTVAFDTEVFDQGSDFATGTFTAPVTGIYSLFAGVKAEAVGATNTQAFIEIIASNRALRDPQLNATTVKTAGNDVGMTLSGLLDMDANDTAVVAITVIGGTKTVGVGGSSVLITFFSGNLTA